MINTERLRLEPFSAPLIDAALAGDRAAIAALGYSAPPGWPEPDLLEALPVFRELLAGDTPEGFNSWLILHKGTGEIAGSAGFTGGPDRDGNVEIGFGVLPGERRRGYCREAVKALMEWALDRPGVRRITARCAPDNVPSAAALGALGFSRSGESEGLMAWEYARP